MQPHLKKCFEAIKSVKFNEDLEIVSMKSREKEVVEFVEAVPTQVRAGQTAEKDHEKAPHIRAKPSARS